MHEDESEQPFVLSAPAADDIREIWEYIAADSVDADRVVDELYEMRTCPSLLRSSRFAGDRA